ncbi:MAG TPA: hypothetical protein V6D29_05655 [Leptolyngbyaceae cyanobacterium]
MHTPRKPRFNLSDYPHAIARVRTAIARLDREIAELEHAIELIEVKLDTWIANASDLKNDAQRRAKRGELRINDINLNVKQDLLQTAKEKRTKEEIKLELLRSMFSVAKLQARYEIAAIATDSDLALAA